MERKLVYPANFTKDGKFILVTFPDVPEAITQGEGITDALAMAKDVLACAMEFYAEDGRPLPIPSKPTLGQHLIEFTP